MFLDPLSTDIIKPSIGPPTLENPFESVNLFPTIPATSPGTNNNSDFFTYAQGLLDKDVNPIAAPLYDVTKEQKERYDNPYLAYTPSTQGAKSIEGIYGMYQGAGEQLLNGVLKGGVKAIGTFLESFVAVPNQIDSLRKGDVSNALFAESSSFNAITNWMDSFENSLPNYLTDIEQERPWYINAFTPTGAANFWGDTIIKNGGFMIGALASAAVVDGAITLATGGLGAEVALIDFGRRLGSTIPKMKSAFRGLSKVAALGKTDDVIGIMNTGENLLEATKIAKQTNTLAQLGKAGHFAATTYFSTQGEAMIEGYHTYVDTKTKLLEEAISRGETLSPELLAGIEDTASNAGKMTAIFNAAVLTPSNMIQFPKLMGWKKMTNLTKKIDNPYIKYDLQEEGLKAINTYSRKKAVANVLKDVGLKSFLPEGLEEGSQYFIGNSLHDYYIDKFNNKTKAGLGEYMLNALPKTLGEGEFWKEFFIGAISSSTFGGLFPGSEVQTSIKANLIGAKARTDGYVSSINDNLDKFNAAAAQLTSFGELVNFDATPAPGVPSVPKAPFDFINKHESAYKAFHRVVSDAATFGQLETLKDSINDLKELSLEEFNKLSFVGTGLPGGEKGVKTETEKEAGLNQMLIEIDKIQEDLDAVEESFKINPFNNESQKKRLKDFGLKEEELDNAVYSLFQEFKKNQVYTIGRLRNIQDSQNSFFNELKFGANLDPDSIDNLKLVLLNIQDQPSLQSYLEYKSRVLQTLNTQYDLYTTEGTKNPVNAGKIKRAKDNLTRLITYLNNFNLAQELTQEDKDAITEAIFVEEFGENQANLAYLANMQALQLIRQGAEEELKFANENPEEFAKKMQEVTEELTRQYNEDRKTPEQKEAERKQKEKEDKEREEKLKREMEDAKQKEKTEEEETIEEIEIKVSKGSDEDFQDFGQDMEEDEEGIDIDIDITPAGTGTGTGTPKEKPKAKTDTELLEDFLKERKKGKVIPNSEAEVGDFYLKKGTKVTISKTTKLPYVIVYKYNGTKDKNGVNQFKKYKVTTVNGKIIYEEIKGNLQSVRAPLIVLPKKGKDVKETKTEETTEPIIVPDPTEGKFPIYEAEKVEKVDLKTKEGREEFKKFIRRKSQSVKLNGNYYINSLGRVFVRTTSVIKDEELESNVFFKTAIGIGNKVDLLIRKIFEKPGVVTYDSVKQELNNLFSGKEEDAVLFLDAMNRLKEQMEARGEEFLSDDIKIYSNTYGYAGALDLLTIDKDGIIRVYDVKTFRTAPTSDKYTKKYNGESYESKHTKQLSLYAKAFEEMYGVPVSSISVIPIHVGYNVNDKKTNRLVLYPPKTLNKKDNVSEIITKQALGAVSLTKNITEFLGDKSDLYGFFIRAIRNDLFTVNCN